jgi:DNA-binding CsgD family transcriptional regulator
MEARGRTPNPLGSITVRELQILSLLAEGKPYGQIAGSLNVSYKTIANTWGQLKFKLGVRSLPELMRSAIEYLPSVARQELQGTISDGPRAVRPPAPHPTTLIARRFPTDRILAGSECATADAMSERCTGTQPHR